MTAISAYERKTLDEFLRAIEPMLPGYGYAAFSYFAIKQDQISSLIQGRLYLLGVPLQTAIGRFESATVKAGCFNLNEQKKSPGEMLDEILTGRFMTPHGELHFSPNQNSPYSVFFNPFHLDGIQSQRRQMQLMITGGQPPQSNSLQIDWELKAAELPFDGVQELCNEYGIGGVNGHQVSVEILAHNLAAIDMQSTVKKNKAFVALLLSEGLDPFKASIGFRLIDKGRVVKRAQISGSKFDWDTSESLQRGKVEIDVPAGAVLHCIANYGGKAHHHWWVTDPSTAQNPRRAIHQTFDDKMEILKELLKAQGRGQEAREFETAISWIIWMLGFNVTNIGGTRRSAESPDLVATTPKGHFLVVECTTGILKAEDKLAKLIDRSERARQSLLNSGNGHLKVLPIIVTNKSREEVKGDLEQAEKSGVLVGTRDDFEELINLTIAPPDPDLLYDRAQGKVEQAKKTFPFELG